MNIAKNIIVICEGESEWVYLQRLNAALARLPFPDGWVDVPVRFIGRPKKTGVKTGAFKAVEREVRLAMKQNPSIEKWVWVDADIYVRNEKACGENYQRRSLGIPPFHFSVLNFEDFLAFHLDDDKFELWVKTMAGSGHFKCPLSWKDYHALWQCVFPDYLKGDLPADFITLESLSNMKRHLAQMPLVELGALKIERTFAQSLIDELSHWYKIS